MTAPPDEGRNRSLRERLLLGLAAAAVTWERLWPAIAPACGVVAIFLAVALFDILPALPTFLHSMVLMAFGIGFLIALGRGLRGFSTATHAQARHRLESDSGLQGRPLAVLDDHLASGTDDPMARLLWQAHRERAAAAAGRLTVRLPRPGLAARDPWAVRMLVALIVVVAGVIGGTDPADRLVRALQPGGKASNAIAQLDLWITPPAHTARPPLYRAQGDATPFEAPEGSQVLVRMRGAGRAPVMTIVDQSLAFDRPQDGGHAGFQAETTLQGAGQGKGDITITGERGRTLAHWPGRVLADLPPEVERTGLPGTAPPSRLAIPYRIRDDYGIQRLSLSLARTPEEQKRLTLPLPLKRADTAGWQSGEALRDLGDHPWAGLAVTLWLEAEDGAGQTGRSNAIRMTLPERTFQNVLAQTLMAVRKSLNSPDANVRIQAHGTLSALRDDPTAHNGRLDVHLGLGVAVQRLLWDRSDAGRREVQDLLWEMALALEDGGLSLALRDVERLREALDKALQSGADARTTDALMAALKQAMNRYLGELAAKLGEQDASQQMSLGDAETLGSDEIQAMLDRARALAEAGDTDGARQVLAKLARMMAALQSGMENMPSAAQLKQARQAMEALQSLYDRQNQLHQETFDAIRDREREDARLGRFSSTMDLNAQANAQKKLTDDTAKALGRLKALLDKMPTALPKARRNMISATEDLTMGKGQDALSAQARALDALGKAMNEASQALAQQMGGVSLGGRPGGRPGGGRDPFGRNQAPGGAGQGETKIPGAANPNAARSILRELRNRASQPNRSSKERDYIRRLLGPF